MNLHLYSGAMLCLIGYMITSQKHLVSIETEYQIDRQKAKEYEKVSEVLRDEEWLAKVESEIRRSKAGAASRNMLKNIMTNKIREALSVDENHDDEVEILTSHLKEPTNTTSTGKSAKISPEKQPQNSKLI
jgi:hypothetical protein